MRPSAVALVGASASWCSRGFWAVVCHVVRKFLFCIYVLGGGWSVRAGYVFFGVVRRFYIIIIGLLGRFFFVFSCVGAVVGCRSRRLLTGSSKSTYEACVAAVLAVAWGLLVADCVVWVQAI